MSINQAFQEIKQEEKTYRAGVKQGPLEAASGESTSFCCCALPIYISNENRSTIVGTPLKPLNTHKYLLVLSALRDKENQNSEDDWDTCGYHV
jgi:hypothetical protein